MAEACERGGPTTGNNSHVYLAEALFLLQQRLQFRDSSFVDLHADTVALDVDSHEVNIGLWEGLEGERAD
jgi:hypothetical protein